MNTSTTLYRGWLAWQSALTETDFNHRIAVAIGACDQAVEKLWAGAMIGLARRPRIWVPDSENGISVHVMTAEVVEVQYFHNGDLEYMTAPLAALSLSGEEIARWAGRLVDETLTDVQRSRDAHEANERETLHRLMEKYPDELEKVTAE